MEYLGKAFFFYHEEENAVNAFVVLNHAHRPFFVCEQNTKRWNDSVSKEVGFFAQSIWWIMYAACIWGLLTGASKSLCSDVEEQLFLAVSLEHLNMWCRKHFLILIYRQLPFMGVLLGERRKQTNNYVQNRRCLSIILFSNWIILKWKFEKLRGR